MNKRFGEKTKKKKVDVKANYTSTSGRDRNKSTNVVENRAKKNSENYSPMRK